MVQPFDIFKNCWGIKAVRPQKYIYSYRDLGEIKSSLDFLLNPEVKNE